MVKGEFVTSIEEIRKRAREHMEDGPISPTYGANRDAVVKVLNDALATELVCVLRYKRHYYMARGINSEPVAAEFLQHAEEEQAHADSIAERITQLGGEPDFNPTTFRERAHSEYKEGTDLVDMVKENLVAERIAVDTYREIVRYLGEDDPTSRRLIESILEVEEEHADDMANLLTHFTPPNGKQK
jgi:bacterioferritin